VLSDLCGSGAAVNKLDSPVPAPAGLAPFAVPAGFVLVFRRKAFVHVVVDINSGRSGTVVHTGPESHFEVVSGLEISWCGHACGSLRGTFPLFGFPIVRTGTLDKVVCELTTAFARFAVIFHYLFPRLRKQRVR